MKMEASNSYETLVTVYQIRLRHIQEDSHRLVCD
jgi:hypothetical protein